MEHPAAKVLVELANLQDSGALNPFHHSLVLSQRKIRGLVWKDSEVGDGTTSVVIIAAELYLGCRQNVRNFEAHLKF